MSDDQIELIWIEDGKFAEGGKDLAHLAIALGDLRVQDGGGGDAVIHSQELFTACGISIPSGSTLFPTDDKDVNCDPCLDSQYGLTVEAFIKDTLKEPAVT